MLKRKCIKEYKKPKSVNSTRFVFETMYQNGLKFGNIYGNYGNYTLNDNT